MYCDTCYLVIQEGMNNFVLKLINFLFDNFYGNELVLQ